MVFNDYRFDPDPDVAAAERRWLEAIADNRGHAEINDRWQVVQRLKDLSEGRRVVLRKQLGRSLTIEHLRAEDQT